MTRLVAFAAGMALLLPGAALAQSKKRPVSTADRGTIYINGAYQGTPSDVQSTVKFAANAETATFTTSFRVKAGPALDVGGRVRVWKRLSVGVAYTSFAANRDADVTASIPHPFFFNQPRSVSGTAPFERKETVVHLRVVAASAPGRRLQLTGFAGPAFYSVTQTLVERVNYLDVYPFDSVTFASAATRRVSQSKTGFGAGADVAYYFSKNGGVGLTATYAKADIDLKAIDDSTVTVHAGGATAGVGLRIRF